MDGEPIDRSRRGHVRQRDRHVANGLWAHGQLTWARKLETGLADEDHRSRE